ncbi:MAG: SusE domain-containing protein [Muribaculaceae bacterium]|nr:SusE domain-containing protein [Muribaculaceae bacterium]
MKKISLWCAGLIAAMSMSGCGENTDPQYHYPDEPFVLNNPPLASQFYDLASAGTVNLVCSQPAYGFQAVTNYEVQVSLDPDFESINQNIDGSGEAPGYVALGTTYTTTSIDVPAEEIAQAVNACLGIKTMDECNDYIAANGAYHGAVYVRLQATIPQVGDRSAIVSNAVRFDNMLSYATVRVPGVVYLVGSFSGWTQPTPPNAGHYADWSLSEADDAIGSKIYTGTYTIPAGSQEFRIYSELTDWGNGNNYGPSLSDSKTIDFVDGVAAGNMVYAAKEAKNWKFDWPGGSIRFTVNLKKLTLTMEAVDSQAE